MNNIKQWYVKIQQWENDMFKEGEMAESAIYMAIKSYAGNGTMDVGLSLRDIASRAKTNPMTVSRYLPKLITKGMITIVGEETRIGGTVKVYRIVTHSVTDSYTLLKESVTPSGLSVTPSGLSVTTVATKPYELKNIRTKDTHSSKKLLQPLSQEKLYSLSLKLNIHVRKIVEKQNIILDMQANGELKRPYKNMERTLTNWLRGDLSKGYLTEMDDAEKLDNDAEEPERKARFIAQIQRKEAHEM